jgi:hypothetical protein
VPYGGVAHSIDAMLRATEGPRGATHPAIRFLAEHIVRDVAAKDYLSEVLAIRYWVNSHVPYLRDPVTVEWLRDPLALVDEIKATGKGGKLGIVRADCDEIAMLCASLAMAVGNECDFVPVGFSSGGAPTHVLCRVRIHKAPAPMVIDPVAGTREAKMLGTVQNLKIYPIGA